MMGGADYWSGRYFEIY